MTPNEMEVLGNALDKLALVYQEPFSQERKAVYLEILDRLSLDLALYACEAWALSDHAFFPKPGQLYTLATMLPAPPQVLAELQARAEQAWMNVRGNGRVQFNAWALADPTTKHVFRAMGGGYTTEGGFGLWPAQYEEVKRREFLAAYLERFQREPSAAPLPTAPRQLPRADYDDSPDEAVDEPVPQSEVQQLLTQLAAKLALPPAGVPLRYLREVQAAQPLTYKPSLTPEEVESRKTLLIRQAQQVMAQENIQRALLEEAARSSMLFFEESHDADCLSHGRAHPFSPGSA